MAPRIRDMITTVYQPIVNLLNGEVIGYESLGRLKGQENAGFGPLAEWARATHRTTAVMRNLTQIGIDNAADRPAGSLLFLNGRLAELPRLAQSANSLAHVVLEVPESDRRLAEWDVALEPLRHRGMRVAIDDWGVGTADPLRLIQLRPQWVKLDVALVRRIHDYDVAHLVELLVQWVSADTYLIAEGIESDEQLLALRRLGVSYGQGFALARPSNTWPKRLKLPGTAVREAHLRVGPLALSQAVEMCDEDLALVAAGRDRVRPLLGQATDDFVRWLAATLLTARIPELDPNHHSLLLMRHFDQLMRGELGPEDMERASRIARVHQEYSFDLSYYVTGYRRLQETVLDGLPEGDGALKAALRKLFDWDMSLVLSAYQSLMERDSQTGLFTRQAFWDRVTRDISMAHAGNRVGVLAVVDVDGIKSINDQHGHLAGDRAIQRLGRLLFDFAASSYWVGRMGGDVFAIWAPNRPLNLVERDLATLAARVIEGSETRLTFSFGLARLGANGTTAQALYAYADHDLYLKRRLLKRRTRT